MSKRATLDARIDAISQARRGPLTPASLEVLRAGLNDSHAVIVERAAVAACELRATALIPELASAFDRFLDNPGADKSCVTVTALADTLQAFSAPEDALYLRGLRVRRMQLAPEKSDLATGLRCACAMGLATMGYRDALWEMAGFLHDDQPRCRATAVRAIALIGSPAGMPLLRFKVTAGDGDAEVIGDCFTALASLDPARGIPFVADYLDDADDSIAESAALALGESRRPAAFEALRDRFHRNAHADLRRVLLLAIGLLRSEAAVDFVISVIATDPPTAPDAIRALAIYRRDDSVRSRVAAAVEAIQHPAATRAFATEFG